MPQPLNVAQRWIVLLIIYLLFLLIGIAALGAVLGFFPNVDATFKKYCVATLFVDIAGAAIAVFYSAFREENRLFVNLAFQGKKPKNVALTLCRYEVYDGDKVLKKKGEATVVKSPGGWQISFPAVSGGYARLELTERDQTVWHVPHFALNVIAVEAERQG